MHLFYALLFKAIIPGKLNRALKRGIIQLKLNHQADRDVFEKV